MKKIKTALLAVMASVMLALGLATPAFAAPTAITTNNEGTVTELCFQKVARQDNVTDMDNVTFTFKLEPYTGTIASGTKANGFEVVKGVGSQTVTLNTKTSTQMTESDSSYTNAEGNTVTGRQATSVDSAAKFDISNLGTLQANKAYRYQVTESSSSSQFKAEEGKIVDTTTGLKSHKSYIVDLYTDDDAQVVAAIAYGFGDITSPTIDEANKAPVVFYNASTEEKGAIKIMKSVKDTNGAFVKDETFNFELTLNATTGLDDYPTGTEFAVTAYNQDGTAGSTASTAKVKVGTAYSFTLKNGGYLQINGLPVGMDYTVKEVAKSDELVGYKTSINTETGLVTSAADVKTVHVAAGAAGAGNQTKDLDVVATGKTILFINDGSTTVLTGVLMNIAPYAIVVVVAIAGIAIYTVKKRNSSEY